MDGMKLPPRGSVTLVGVRAPSGPDDAACAKCHATGAPAIALMHRQAGADWSMVARLCLPCVGSAVEAATGWKIQRAWSQWLASSLQAQTMRTNKLGERDNLK